jgi:hypothetical protein
MAPAMKPGTRRLEDDIIAHQLHRGIKVVGVDRRLEAARYLADLILSSHTAIFLGGFQSPTGFDLGTSA